MPPWLRLRTKSSKFTAVTSTFTGAETVGWSALGNLECESEKPFDAENDFALYNTPADVYFTAQPGQFYVMFPEDAHAPIIGQGKLRKAIAKVLLPE